MLLVYKSLLCSACLMSTQGSEQLAFEILNAPNYISTWAKGFQDYLLCDGLCFQYSIIQLEPKQINTAVVNTRTTNPVIVLISLL